jgi:hypothetical protein
MGTQEVSYAYPTMTREWKSFGGYVLRLVANPAKKGMPDFLLTHMSTGSILTEVKSVMGPHEFIGLDYDQAKTLDELHAHGAKVRVLVRCIKLKQWGIFFPVNYVKTYKILRYDMCGRQIPHLYPTGLQ